MNPPERYERYGPDYLSGRILWILWIILSSAVTMLRSGCSGSAQCIRWQSSTGIALRCCKHIRPFACVHALPAGRSAECLKQPPSHLEDERVIADHRHVTSSSSQLPQSLSTSSMTLPVLSVLGLVLALQFVEPALAHQGPIADLAEGGPEFWSNVLRYGRYFVTVMLGTGYVMLRPITSEDKGPHAPSWLHAAHPHAHHAV